MPFLTLCIKVYVIFSIWCHEADPRGDSQGQHSHPGDAGKPHSGGGWKIAEISSNQPLRHQEHSAEDGGQACHHPWPEHTLRNGGNDWRVFGYLMYPKISLRYLWNDGIWYWNNDLILSSVRYIWKKDIPIYNESWQSCSSLRYLFNNWRNICRCYQYYIYQNYLSHISRWTQEI